MGDGRRRACGSEEGGGRGSDIPSFPARARGCARIQTTIHPPSLHARAGAGAGAGTDAAWLDTLTPRYNNSTRRRTPTLGPLS